MLRVTGRCLRILRFSSSQANPKDPGKKVTFFNPYRPEDSMTELLRRESPLLEISTGKVERPPFLLNLFVDRFDERFLTYPEVLEARQVDKLEDLYNRVRTYLGTLDYKDLRNGPSKQVWSELQKLGLFSMGIPEEYGGTGFFDTEFIRIMEAFSTHPSLGTIILSHNVSGVFALLNYGSETLKRLYLPKLASGELTSAFALTEPGCGADVAGMKTRALVFEEEDHYVVTGKKVFVTNGEKADLLTVACNLEKVALDENKIKAISLLLIDRRWTGVKVKKIEGLIGLQGSGLVEIELDKVKVPKDHLLGERGRGFAIAMDLQTKTRLGLTALSVGIARDALNRTIDYALKNKRHNKRMIEHEDIMFEIATMAQDLFGMESTLYLTSAISDVVMNPHYALESAATKLIAMKGTRNILAKSLNILGVKRLYDESAETRWFLDQMMLESYESPIFVNYMLLAMNGLKKVASEKLDLIGVMNAPYESPLKFLKHVRDVKKYRKDTIKLYGELDQFLHPTLANQSRILEFLVRQLTMAGMALINIEGKEGLEKQTKLKRLGEMACDVYLSSAVLARASRSYCIGLRNSFQEMKMASVTNEEATLRVTQHCEKIREEYEESELQMKIDLTEQFAEYRGYGIEHPLKKNWN